MRYYKLTDIATIILPVALGTWLYLAYRSTQIRVFGWANTLALQTQIQQIRHLKPESLPDWVVFSLPAALWVFAWIYAMAYVWRFQTSKAARYWRYAAATLALASELAQAVQLIAGHFDTTDLVCMFVATIIAFTAIHFRQQIYN
ncbi:MAG: hypothetical protein RIS47_9 [Bacteroidota bacterium]|jgi:hypothetical protein